MNNNQSDLEQFDTTLHHGEHDYDKKVHHVLRVGILVLVLLGIGALSMMKILTTSSTKEYQAPVESFLSDSEVDVPEEDTEVYQEVTEVTPLASEIFSKRYSNESYEFSLSYPESWVVIASETGARFFEESDSDNLRPLLVLEVLENPEDFATYEERLVDEVTQSQDTTEKSEVSYLLEYINIGENDALFHTRDYDAYTGKLTEVYIPLGTRLVHIYSEESIPNLRDIFLTFSSFALPDKEL